MIDHSVEYWLENVGMLSCVVVVWLGGGRRGVRSGCGSGDGESVFVRGEEVPVTSNEE